jgi:hypothetical protein
MSQNSILSNQFRLYGIIDNDIEDNKVCDVLTLTDPDKEDSYFNWIYIPITENTYNTYTVESLYNYMKHYNFNNVPDPHRGYKFIDFIKTRLVRYKNNAEAFKDIKIKDITDEFRSNILNNIIDTYKNNIPKYYNDIGAIINMKTLLDNNMIFDLDVNRAANILQKKPTGSFLIRNSSCSNLTKDFTIFTITHSYIRNGNKFINNMRYLTIHGIGVYDIGHLDRNYFINLTKKMFLENINYKEADYACIMDVIIYLHNAGDLDITKQIINMP